MATHYVRRDEPAVGDQLDLFLDSGITVALQDLRAALNARALEDAKRCLAIIEHKLLPAAGEVLGSRARDLMAVFWQRLAAALVDLPFDPERPKLHVSYACIQYLDWQRAIMIIEAVPGHATSPVLLERLARARYYNGQYRARVVAFFRPQPRQALEESDARPSGRL